MIIIPNKKDNKKNGRLGTANSKYLLAIVFLTRPFSYGFLYMDNALEKRHREG